MIQQIPRPSTPSQRLPVHAGDALADQRRRLCTQLSAHGGMGDGVVFETLSRSGHPTRFTLFLIVIIVSARAAA